MTKLQFRVLYREFLFRMVDLELLSSHALGDASKLFGQFAALLVFLSVLFSIAALGFGGGRTPPLTQLMLGWSMEHFLISTTMLVVGLFAVLSWDSTFPDRRDVLVLAPLPVRARTLFLAKVSAVAAALGLTVLILHCGAGLVWPLALHAQSAALAVPTLTYEPALPPVDAEGLQAVLQRDLAPALHSGALAPATRAGLAIGVSTHGVRRVFTYGTARPDSIFEIGSISKTFTGLILARMAAQGKLRLDEPVRALLPAGSVPKPNGNEITLLDLATHNSGLPPMPTNLNRDGLPNPGADYHAADLYAYLGKHGLRKPADAAFLYSNLGVGLLGQALADRAGTTYPRLLQEEVTRALGMTDTGVVLDPVQQGRLIQAFDSEHKAVPAWDLDALAGAGAIRSTAGDLLTYLDANLHPARLAAGTDRTLSIALQKSHELRAEVVPGLHIALAWVRSSETGTYWHSGAISGYTSHAFFHPQGDYAAVVLLNQAPTPIPFTELLAQHIRQRLAGEPAISLATVQVPESTGILGLLRWYVVYWFTMLAAGAFIFCCVLGAQGLAAQLLPRRLFLRVSSFLQLAAFCLFVSVYFLQPVAASPPALSAAQGHTWLAWSPSYWFLGLLQMLSGSPALAPLAHRACIGLAIAVSSTAVAYALSYFRALRQIVEEPDIVPGRPGVNWLPRFGDALQTAIAQFSIRTLFRSRRHRIILAFYLGIGFALIIFLLKIPAAPQPLPDAPASDAWRQVNAPLLAASIVMMIFSVVGTRAVFSLPLDLRANWIFRCAGTPGGSASLAAGRRTLVALSVAPVWLVSALLCLWFWPWQQAAAHLAALALIGMILADLCLYGFQKIPFTCSYLPGKSQVQMAFLGAAILLWTIVRSVQYEREMLESPTGIATLLAVLGTAAVFARWRTAARARTADPEAQFEEEPAEQILTLDLYWDNRLTKNPRTEQ